MENATKALLIAAAVLVAILIISLGLMVYNMASETVGNVNLSGQEVAAFNEKFVGYDGPNKRGSEVNAMLKTVLNHNLTNETKIAVVAESGSEVSLDTNATSITKQANVSKLYKVTVEYEAKTGLVKQIKVAPSAS